MIKAIQELGQLLLKEKNTTSILTSLLTTADLNKIQLVLEIHIKNGEYTKVYYVAYQKEDGDKYLYKKGPGNGGDYTLSSRLSKDTNTKTFLANKTLNRFKNCFNNLLAKKSLSEDDKKLINTLNDNFTSYYKEIEKELYNLANKLNKKDGYLVTFIIDDKPLSEFKVFKDSILEDFYSKSYTKQNKKSIGTNQVCSICLNKKAEVYGLSKNFSFYTLDKWSFVNSGFDLQKAWRNYPVCPECLLEVELGKRKLMSEFSFSFCGFRYLLIPKLVTSKDEELKKVYDLLKDFKGPSFEKEVKQGIIDGENEVLELFKDKSNNLNLFFLFYKIDNSAFRILLTLEGFNPSLIRKLYCAQDKAHNEPMFKRIKKLEVLVKAGYEPRFTFKVVRNFLEDKSFLEIIGKTFTLRHISYQYLIAMFINKIRYQFVNNYSSLIQTSDAFLILYFLHHLNLIKVKGGNMDKFHDNDTEEEFTKHFEDHKSFFSNEQCTAFLVGVLVQKLLNIQYQDKKASPFYKHLNGLQVNEKLLRRVFVKAQNKLIEYEKNYYVKLEVLISKYFEVSDLAKTTSDEISFYFITGMNLSRLFLKKEDSNSDSSS